MTKYRFQCLECNNVFYLVLRDDQYLEEEEIRCWRCDGEEVEYL